jgi:hypothetical protein
MTNIINQEDKTLQDDKVLYEFTKSDGWAMVRKLFLAKIDELDRVSAIDVLSYTNKEALVCDILSKRMAIDVLKELLHDIDGASEQIEFNTEMIEDTEQDFVNRT